MKDNAKSIETDVKNCTYYLGNPIDTNNIDFKGTPNY